MNDAVLKELPIAREVCPTTSRRLLSQGALLVDVREPAEVERSAFAECEQLRIPMSEFEVRWSEIPRDRDVIVACRIGERSLKATYFLMYQGYDRVVNMQYGMERWFAKGFPVSGHAGSGPANAQGSSCCSEDRKSSPSADCDCASAGCC